MARHDDVLRDGASAAMPATRSVPTLTHVPELSLKSSATRPSKTGSLGRSRQQASGVAIR